MANCTGVIIVNKEGGGTETIEFQFETPSENNVSFDNIIQGLMNDKAKFQQFIDNAPKSLDPKSKTDVQEITKYIDSESKKEKVLGNFSFATLPENALSQEVNLLYNKLKESKGLDIIKDNNIIGVETKFKTSKNKMNTGIFKDSSGRNIYVVDVRSKKEVNNFIRNTFYKHQFNTDADSKALLDPIIETILDGLTKAPSEKFDAVVKDYDGNKTDAFLDMLFFDSYFNREFSKQKNEIAKLIDIFNILESNTQLNVIEHTNNPAIDILSKYTKGFDIKFPVSKMETLLDADPDLKGLDLTNPDHLINAVQIINRKGFNVNDKPSFLKILINPTQDNIYLQLAKTEPKLTKITVNSAYHGFDNINIIEKVNDWFIYKLSDGEYAKSKYLVSDESHLTETTTDINKIYNDIENYNKFETLYQYQYDKRNKVKKDKISTIGVRNVGNRIRQAYDKMNKSNSPNKQFVVYSYNHIGVGDLVTARMVDFHSSFNSVLATNAFAIGATVENIGEYISEKTTHTINLTPEQANSLKTSAYNIVKNYDDLNSFLIRYDYHQKQYLESQNINRTDDSVNIQEAININHYNAASQALNDVKNAEVKTFRVVQMSSNRSGKVDMVDSDSLIDSGSKAQVLLEEYTPTDVNQTLYKIQNRSFNKELSAIASHMRNNLGINVEYINRNTAVKLNKLHPGVVGKSSFMLNGKIYVNIGMATTSDLVRDYTALVLTVAKNKNAKVYDSQVDIFKEVFPHRFKPIERLNKGLQDGAEIDVVADIITSIYSGSLEFDTNNPSMFNFNSLFSESLSNVFKLNRNIKGYDMNALAGMTIGDLIGSFGSDLSDVNVFKKAFGDTSIVSESYRKSMKKLIDEGILINGEGC